MLRWWDERQTVMLGANFNREVEANGLSRNDFYICNTVRCYTVDNERPTDKQVQRCKPFLDIEINLIRPQVIVALGSVAFGRLCPSLPFSEYLGKMVESVEYEAPVFAVYHPSPLNLEDPQRAVAFKKHMKLLCSIVKGLKK
jgi:DNA polymerase